MEVDDAQVERQKLVEETEERALGDNKSTPASPVVVPKINIKSISSDTTRSRNSATCSIEPTTSDKGQTSAKVTYVNERSSARPRPQQDERFEFKSRPRKLLKDIENNNEGVSVNGELSINSITQLGSNTSLTNSQHTNNKSPQNRTPLALHRKASNSKGGSPLTLNHNTIHSDKFDDRHIKHHSFVSEVPDVKHMERALLGLLDDFHSGKLKAFGSGCTMDQMTKIREQQESLAKLHFELAAAEEDDGTDLNAVKAQDNMVQLVQRLEQLSISIEQLQTSHTSL